MRPDYINPPQWQYAMGVARQTCARVFRDGGGPADALEAFGITAPDASSSWNTAVEIIARALCDQTTKKAA